MKLQIPIFLLLSACVAASEIDYTRRIESKNSRLKYTGINVYEKIGQETGEYNDSLPLPRGNYTGIYKVGTPYEALGQKFYPHEDESYDKRGEASWYGEDFHNKKTSNGETYNMNDMTAAHPTLPMPSVVKITNLENGRSVNVRVNDRGPFVKGRLIDVSRRVATELGFHQQGTTRVRVQFLKKDTDELLKRLGLKKV